MSVKITETLSTADYIRQMGTCPKTIRCKCGNKLFEYEKGLLGTIRIKCRKCGQTIAVKFIKDKLLPEGSLGRMVQDEE